MCVFGALKSDWKGKSVIVVLDNNKKNKIGK